VTTTDQRAARERRRAEIAATKRNASSTRVSEETRRTIFLLGGVILAAAVVAAAIYGLSLLGAPPAKLGVQEPDYGANHVATRSPIEYASYPPTSGNHYPQWADPGNYEVQIPEGFWLHSLEHGYTVLLYRPELDGPAIREQIAALLPNLPKSVAGYHKFIAMPYDRLPEGENFNLVAWRHRLPLDSFDATTIQNFYRSHVDKGPEANAA
jgi:hypothetical protein